MMDRNGNLTQVVPSPQWGFSQPLPLAINVPPLWSYQISREPRFPVEIDVEEVLKTTLKCWELVKEKRSARGMEGEHLYPNRILPLAEGKDFLWNIWEWWYLRAPRLPRPSPAPPLLAKNANASILEEEKDRISAKEHKQFSDLLREISIARPRPFSVG